MPRLSPPRLRLLLLAILAILLAGCGSDAAPDPTAEPTQPPPAATAPAGAGTVTVAPSGTPDAVATPLPRAGLATPELAAPPSPSASPWVPPDVPQASPVAVIPVTAEQVAADNLLAGEEGVYGFVVLEQDGTVVASVNGTTPFITASLYKLVLMADILMRVESGMLSLDDTLVLGAEEFGNYGDMYFAEDEVGAAFTIEEYLFAAGAYSSNAAARTLLTLTSTEVLNMTAMLIGMDHTRLFSEPTELPFWPPEPGVDATPEEVALAQEYLEESAQLGPVSVTTPLDMARYQLALMNDMLISPWVSQQVGDILAAQILRDGLPAMLDGEVPVVNKPGSLPDAAHDVGIIFVPGQPRAVATMAMGVPDPWRATLLEQRLALIATGDVNVPPMPW